MIKTLSNAFGPSGCEKHVAEIIMSFLPASALVSMDKMGNLYATKEPEGESKGTIMLCAHMDEVGFIISEIHEDGTLSFQPVGGISSSCLLGKRVCIGETLTHGVIGTVAVHQLTKESKEQDVPISKMYIDIGAADATDAKTMVSVGDYVIFDTQFLQTETCFFGKALDDRLGCAAIIEILNCYQPKNYRLVACFTVQEETGLRGAKVASRVIQPDVAIVFETTTCNDIPNEKEEKQVTQFGEGVALSVADACTIYPANLRDFLVSLAERDSIAFQFKKQTFGGNDCGSISISNGGVPVAVFSIPCRYLHTPVSLASCSDYEASVRLGLAFLKEMETKPWNF